MPTEDPRVWTEEIQGKGWRFRIFMRGCSHFHSDLYADRAAANAAGHAWIEKHELESPTPTRNFR